MKTTLAIVGGIALLILAWYFGFLDFLGIKGGKCTYDPGTGGAPAFPSNYRYGKCNVKTPDMANNCDANRPGYRKDGVKDPNCGNVPCDQNKPGYDADGFPDPNCGFGRINTTNERRAQGERMQINVWQFNSINENGASENLFGKNPVSSNFKIGDTVQLKINTSSKYIQVPAVINNIQYSQARNIYIVSLTVQSSLGIPYPNTLSGEIIK